jgi:hypothetical protein
LRIRLRAIDNTTSEFGPRVTIKPVGNPASRWLEKHPSDKQDGVISSCLLSIMLPAKGVQIQKDKVNGRKIGCNTVLPILPKIVIIAHNYYIQYHFTMQAKNIHRI